MADKGIYFEVKGEGECLAKISKVGKNGEAVIAREFEKTLIEIHNKAKRSAPVNIGQLRAGIHWRMNHQQVEGEVGSYVKHAAFMEFGTGPAGAASNKQKLPPWYKHGSHHKFPPVAAFTSWAKAHGAEPGAVAMGIFKRQGLKARPYFFPAVEEEIPKLQARLKAKFDSGMPAGVAQ
jgi:hypothetical protein